MGCTRALAELGISPEDICLGRQYWSRQSVGSCCVQSVTRFRCLCIGSYSYMHFIWQGAYVMRTRLQRSVTDLWMQGIRRDVEHLIAYYFLSYERDVVACRSTWGWFCARGRSYL